MTDRQDEGVEDRERVLDQDDHMRGMERLEMQVTAIGRPSALFVRVTGRIAPADPLAWQRPNVAVRIEVEPSATGRAASRVYTIRSFDPVQSLVEIDFALHPDDSPAMRWLSFACAGTRVSMTGPRAHFLPNTESGRPVAIFADDTAIPAVHAILAADPGLVGDLWVDTADAAAFAALPPVPGLRFHMLPRPKGQGATRPRLLLAAALALPDAAARTLWAAGERDEMKAIRAHFSQAGLGRDDIRVLGYWKHGTSSSQIDRLRLEEYRALRQRGEGLKEFREDALPI